MRVVQLAAAAVAAAVPVPQVVTLAAAVPPAQGPAALERAVVVVLRESRWEALAAAAGRTTMPARACRSSRIAAHRTRTRPIRACVAAGLRTTTRTVTAHRTA